MLSSSNPRWSVTSTRPFADTTMSPPLSKRTTFQGNDIATAIHAARTQARPLLVALHRPTDVQSVLLDGVDDAEVQNELDTNWVTLWLEAPPMEGGDAATYQGFHSFAQVYGTQATRRHPAVVGLNPNDGSVLFVDVEKSTLADLINKREVFQKTMAAAAMATLARLAAANTGASATGANAVSEPAPAPAPAPAPTPPPAPTPAPTAPKPAAPPSDSSGLRRRTGGESSSSIKEKEPVVTVRTPKEITVRVRLPDGSSITGSLGLEATIKDVQALVVEKSPAGVVPKNGKYELWNSWPKERVDTKGDDKTLKELGLDSRPALEVVVGSMSSMHKKKATLNTHTPRNAGASNHGPLQMLLELLRRVWATIALFLGLNEVPSIRGGEAQEGTRTQQPIETQDQAWAAATRGVEASRARGAAGPSSSRNGGQKQTTTRGGGANGNVHSLGSVRDDEDDTQKRFDNGNSTVWGGDGGDGDDGGGGDMNVF
jgi:hypothetical protein